MARIPQILLLSGLILLVLGQVGQAHGYTPPGESIPNSLEESPFENGTTLHLVGISAFTNRNGNTTSFDYELADYLWASPEDGLKTLKLTNVTSPKAEGWGGGSEARFEQQTANHSQIINYITDYRGETATVTYSLTAKAASLEAGTGLGANGYVIPSIQKQVIEKAGLTWESEFSPSTFYNLTRHTDPHGAVTWYLYGAFDGYEYFRFDDPRSIEVINERQKGSTHELWNLPQLLPTELRS